MINSIIFSLLICLFSYTVNAQNSREELREMINNAKSFSVSGEIDKSTVLLLKVYEIAKEKNFEQELLEAGRNLGTNYLNNNDYENALEIANEVGSIAEKLKDNLELSKISRLKGIVRIKYGLYDLGRKEIENSIQYAKAIEDQDKMHLELSESYLNLSTFFYPKSDQHDSVLYYLEKSLDEAKMINDGSESVSNIFKYDMIISLYKNIGGYYIGLHTPPKLDRAEEYFVKALAFKETHPKAFQVDQINTLNMSARFYEFKGEFEKSIPLAEEVLELEKKSRSPDARKLAYATLANSYEALKNKELQIKYTKLYTNLSDSLNYVIQKQVQKPVENVISQNESKNKTSKRKMTYIGIGIIFIIIIAFSIILIYNRKNAQNKYNKLIERLNLEKENHQINKTEINKNSIKSKMSNEERNTPITDETLKTLLYELEKFEKQDLYLKNGVSLTYLAGSWNTNTSYLSQIIKEHKGKSFNSYLNHLRIKYVVKLLYEDVRFREYKISYLAEVCGFSSREVFARAFKKETGISPSYFIENLKKDAE